MRNPEVVLNSLAIKSKDLSYQYERLYRNLYNREFYLMAYAKLASNPGNMGMSIERINCLVESMKNESYQPKPVKRTYIPKSGGGLRPLDIPSFEDKLVQEVIRLLLEAIYEGSFSDLSHGFRPNRSCHTALIKVQQSFMGVKWFIEGDIEGFFNNIDHHILVKLLRKRIKDERFIRLIWKFLRAGYLEDWRFHKTYSGTPQGGIISPILSNIYLNELDHYVEEVINQFNKGTKRKQNREYQKYNKSVIQAKKKLESDALTPEQERQLYARIQEWEKKKRQIPYNDPMDTNFKRLVYVRYADDFLMGVIGSKEDAMQIKQQLTEFLARELKLNLSQEKTLITHSEKNAQFLGFHVRVVRDDALKRDKNGHLRRAFTHKCKLYVPQEKWVNKLKQIGALKIDKYGKWRSMHRPALTVLEEIEILNLYNAEIRGFYNYYCIAFNASSLQRFYHFMKYSLYKTLANKYKTSVKKIIKKYSTNGLFIINYSTKTGIKSTALYNKGFKRVRKPITRSSIDLLTNPYKMMSRTSHKWTGF